QPEAAPAPAAVAPPPTEPQPAPAPAPKPVQVVNVVTVADAQPFGITLAEDVPENAEENRPLRFTVTRDVKVGDFVIIMHGAMATGSIAEAGGKKRLGLFGGKMTLKLLQVDSVDGHKLNIRALAVRKNEGSYRAVETGAPRKVKDMVATTGAEYLA